MVISTLDAVEGLKVDHPDAKDVMMKVLVSPKEGWEDHVMRVFELQEGGHTPKHCHPWPHINYIISGEGIIHLEGKDHPVKPGAFAFIPSDSEHQFRNTGKETFKMICIVPKEGHAGYSK